MIDFLDEEKYPIFCYTNFKTINYSRDLNYYHNIHHIHNMLKLAYKDVEYIKSITDVDAFLTAIAFHDIVYSMKRDDNELASAKLFEQTYDYVFKNNADQFGKFASEEKKKLVFDLILSTKFGSNIITEAEKLLHDYDYITFSNKSEMILADKQILNEGLRDGYNFTYIVAKRFEFYEYLYDSANKTGKFFLTDKYSHLNEIALNNIKENISK